MSDSAMLKAGQMLHAQVLTFAIQFHMSQRHTDLFDVCDNGTCRSSIKHMNAWEKASGMQTVFEKISTAL